MTTGAIGGNGSRGPLGAGSARARGGSTLLPPADKMQAAIPYDAGRMLVEKPGRLRRLLAALAVILLVPPIVGINALIYHARWAYAHFHPEEVAAKPHTISRALADPRVGDFFGHCLSVLAPMLGVGVSLLVWLLLSDWWRSGTGRTRTVSGAAAVGLGHLVILLQAIACVGIVMLSTHSLEQNRDLHMAGSYLFFVGQLLVIAVGGFWCHRMQALQVDDPVFRPSTLRRAAWLARFPVAVALVYIGLFYTKDWVPASLWMGVMQAYTHTEPLTITGFLLYLGYFVYELGGFLARPATRTEALPG